MESVSTLCLYVQRGQRAENNFIYIIEDGGSMRLLEI